MPVNTIGTFKMAGNANSTFSGATATVAFGFGGEDKVLQDTKGKRNIRRLRKTVILLNEFIDFPPFLFKTYEGIQHQEPLSNPR
jgi:hypothetical protein